MGQGRSTSSQEKRGKSTSRQRKRWKDTVRKPWWFSGEATLCVWDAINALSGKSAKVQYNSAN
jgi:hypothetical protein